MLRCLMVGIKFLALEDVHPKVAHSGTITKNFKHWERRLWV